MMFTELSKRRRGDLRAGIGAGEGKFEFGHLEFGLFMEYSCGTIKCSQIDPGLGISIWTISRY